MIKYRPSSYAKADPNNRVRPRFFDQVGQKTMYDASSGNKHFSLNLVIVRLAKIMNRADKNWAQFSKKSIL